MTGNQLIPPVRPHWKEVKRSRGEPCWYSSINFSKLMNCSGVNSFRPLSLDQRALADVSCWIGIINCQTPDIRNKVVFTILEYRLNCRNTVLWAKISVIFWNLWTMWKTLSFGYSSPNDRVLVGCSKNKPKLYQSASSHRMIEPPKHLSSFYHSDHSQNFIWLSDLNKSEKTGKIVFLK